MIMTIFVKLTVTNVALELNGNLLSTSTIYNFIGKVDNNEAPCCRLLATLASVLHMCIPYP